MSQPLHQQAMFSASPAPFLDVKFYSTRQTDQIDFSEETRNICGGSPSRIYPSQHMSDPKVYTQNTGPSLRKSSVLHEEIVVETRWMFMTFLTKIRRSSC